MPHLTVTGQYGAGAVGGKIVKGYADELGKPSTTETFVAIKAHVDNWRWQGVPFYLRTGKRLPARQSEIAIQFKPVPHSIFAERGGQLQPNTLVIRLQPEEYVRLLVMAKQPGLDREGVRLREVPLNLSPRHRIRRHAAAHRLRAAAARPDRGRPDIVRAPRRGRGAVAVDRRDPRRLGRERREAEGLSERELGPVRRQSR